MESVATVDWDAIEGLRDAQEPGAPDIVQEVIGLFLEDGAACVSRARTAFETGDDGEVGQAAHRLRGSAAILDAEAVCRTGTALEAAARSGDRAGVSRRLGVMSEAFDAVACELAVGPSTLH